MKLSPPGCFPFFPTFATGICGNIIVTVSQLYLYNEDLSLLGSLTDIAPGEYIYAARYIGDIVYFITYEKTDPLFAVDISDPTNPIMLGQLEITGYSDYLHPYGDNLLLGIGYETDPDTGDTFYLAYHSTGYYWEDTDYYYISSYDMTEEFKEMETLKY